MSTVGSSERDRTAEIDRCLSLIQPSASDESKFVGMLMLPRLLDRKNTQSVERVFKGMNFKFIERLLRTPKKSRKRLSIYCCVAVKMLDPDVIKNIFHVLMETESKEERDLCSVDTVSL
ncbi:hypothetical protein BDB01DRAFT_900332 [Pilobolus umbonatus]|nr:hypothetical protein BDB01DRAFT_900332 [Pilobolus umbonatus]